jgi:hypothetical protein
MTLARSSRCAEIGFRDDVVSGSSPSDLISGVSDEAGDDDRCQGSRIGTPARAPASAAITVKDVKTRRASPLGNGSTPAAEPLGFVRSHRMTARFTRDRHGYHHEAG